MAGAPHDLPSLLLPTSETAFFQAFVEKTRLHVKSNHAARAEPLLQRWVLDRLLRSEVLPAARLTVMRNGDVVPAAQFRTESGRVRSEALDALIADGVSFVIAGVDDDLPEIAALTGALEQRLGHAVWANVYVTHGPGGALPPHYDDHDVLVLQVHGKKQWYSHGTPTPSPIERSPDGVEFGPPIWETLMSEGDVLFMPRGEVHHTSTVGDVSIHLTFGIDTRRGVDFAASLLSGLEDDVVFREDVTRLSGEDALRARERLLKERLHARVDAMDLRAFLLGDEARRARSTRPGP
jgi:hypothetical protein